MFFTFLYSTEAPGTWQLFTADSQKKGIEQFVTCASSYEQTNVDDLRDAISLPVLVKMPTHLQDEVQPLTFPTYPVQARKWVSPPRCNLYASYIAPFSARQHSSHSVLKCPVLQGIIGLSVAETLNEFGLDARIKMPNDVLVNGKKICGNGLTLGFTNGLDCVDEVSSLDLDKMPTVIGIGLNVNMSQSDCDKIDQPATSMAIEAGVEFDRNTVLNTLTQRLYHNVSEFLIQGSPNFGSFYDRYKSKLLYLGEEIIFRVDASTSLYKHCKGYRTDEGVPVIKCRLKDITENGTLLLEFEGRTYQHENNAGLYLNRILHTASSKNTPAVRRKPPPKEGFAKNYSAVSQARFNVPVHHVHFDTVDSILAYGNQKAIADCKASSRTQAMTSQYLRDEYEFEDSTTEVLRRCQNATSHSKESMDTYLKKQLSFSDILEMLAYIEDEYHKVWELTVNRVTQYRHPESKTFKRIRDLKGRVLFEEGQEIMVRTPNPYKTIILTYAIQPRNSYHPPSNVQLRSIETVSSPPGQKTDYSSHMVPKSFRSL